MSEEPSDFRYSQKSLEEDAYAEADPITDYPDGISAMPVSAANAFMDDDVDQTIITNRTGSSGVQWASSDEYESQGLRFFHDGAWGAWQFYVTRTQHEAVFDGIYHVARPIQDAFAEADSIAMYPDGFSIVSVSAGSDWGGFGQKAFVHTTCDLTDAVQTMYALNGNIYHRVYTSDAWTSWVAV